MENNLNDERRRGPSWGYGKTVPKVGGGYISAEIVYSGKKFVELNRHWYEEYGSPEGKAWFKIVAERVARDGGDWLIYDMVPEDEDGPE